MSVSRRALLIVLLIGIGAVSPSPAKAQDAAALRGIVLDTAGSPMPGVTVSARHALTQHEHTGVTDSGGSYAITGLVPGEYRVQAALSGFQTELTVVDLGAGADVTVDFTLTADRFSGDLVVTAQKREQALQEVPIAIQAFQGEQLEQINVRDFNEVITLVPGASEEVSSNVGLRRYQLRGVAQGPGDPTVGYYIDDSAFFFYGVTNAPMGRTFDLERVEVLRGPQSTLYGNSAMGGVVRYITRAPDLSRYEAHLRSAYAVTSGGDPGGWMDAAVSVPLVEQRLGLRLVGSYQKIGGYQEIPSAGLENVNEAEVTDMRASLLWTPIDRLTLSLMYARNEADQDGSTQVAQTDPPVAIGPPGDYRYGFFDMLTGTLTYDFGGATLSSTTSYIGFDTDGLGQYPFPVPGGLLKIAFVEDAEALNNETRLVSNGDGRLQWLAGAFYSDTEYFLGVDYDPAIAEPQRDTKTSESLSVFGEVSWSLLDGRLVPLAGVRYFTDDRSAVLSSAVVQPEPETFTSVSPRFNLSYLPDDRSTYYVNISKGFRSGNFNSPDVCALHASAGLPCEVAVDSDELWSYELGAKRVLADGQLLLDVALYYQDWSDMRQLVPEFGLFLDYQVGDASIPGVDLQMVFRPASVAGLAVMANGNWNDASVDSLDPAIADATSASIGDRLPFVPEWTLSLAASYDRPLRSGWTGQSSLGYSHIEPQLGQFGTPSNGDARDLLRARVGVHNGTWGFFLFGNNLLDERGAVYAQTPVGGIPFYTQDYPRQIGLEVTFDLW